MKNWILMGLLIPFAAMAQESKSTSCTRGDKVRIIEVIYPQAADVPCEVHYTKGSKTKTLWTASNEGGYCENKAAEFIAKQQRWGWECSTTSPQAESGKNGDESDGAGKQ